MYIYIYGYIYIWLYIWPYIRVDPPFVRLRSPLTEDRAAKGAAWSCAKVERD